MHLGCLRAVVGLVIDIASKKNFDDPFVVYSPAGVGVFVFML